MGFVIRPALFSQRNNIDNTEMEEGVKKISFGTQNEWWFGEVKCPNSFLQDCR